MTTTFDAIIVGAGQAGPPLAGRLTEAGQSVAVIERKLVGGTCVNYGCIPTKTLVASAHTAHTARRGAEYGISTGAVSVDMAAVKARKDKISQDDRHGLESWLEGMDGCTLIRGHARFEGPHTIRVDDQVLEADRIFLNVGGRATAPAIPGLDDVDYLTNVGILDLDVLPDHLVIIGGSYIGLEFAQMYRRFGARVSVVERGPRVTAREDEDVSAAIQQILEAEGIDVHLGATGMRITKNTNGSGDFDLYPRDGAEPISGSHLLVATGRQPNTDDLGLDVAGIETDARGYVTVDDQLRTSVENVWAMGDCNGRGAFTHTSYNDFEIVAANVLDDDPRRVSDRVPTYALYIDPPLGRAGMTAAEVLASGRKALVGKRPMTRVGRAVEKGETQGFMKIVVDAETKHILGASILGVGGDEVVQDILDMMTAGLPYTAISRTMHIHPTVSELVPTVLQELVPLSPN
ncbi:FAD-containing oxidoreductase [Mycolicibacterium hodleri]|uniref:FAD-containing oxidoreductase n=1 Tax=Mycolicibacterium hodleri TaxID=49897 RepID=A0A502E998_9MYCO|nr:FAD-containing oxidoreductase [Mycolicibacterium hodleri]TPG33472.1 FAD-containing oxidoreductase [Mycolicibacterium hodleri]